MRKLLWLLLALTLASPARAEVDLYCLTGSGTFPWQPASTANPCPVVTTPSGTQTITGNIGGYDSGSYPVQTATPNSSSHAAGTSVGGLFSIPIARTNGGAGIITNLYWISTGGAVTQLLVRLWDKQPTNTTCTDQTAFVESITDDQHLLTQPFTITPAAPANTTGDTNTYAALGNLTLDYKNQDGTASKNVYACVLTTATDTADESKAVYINLTGPQD